MRPLRFAPIGFALLLVLFMGCSGEPGPPRHEFETMGTVARLEIHDKGAADDALLAAVTTVYDSVNAVMNTWDPQSEISRLNRAPAGSTLTLSPWLSRCLVAAEGLRERSAGAFEPTAEPLMRLWGFYRRQGRLPAAAELDSVLEFLGAYRHDATRRTLSKYRRQTAFDLGGIAKGFAVDRAADLLRAAGVANALVDLGGNLYCIGGAGAKDHWTVGIRDPKDGGRVFASLELSGRAVATSSSHERFVTIDGVRYGHLMNPETGMPAEGLLSATAVAPTATLADGLSTTLFVLGPDKARRFLERHFPDMDAVLVLPATDEAPARVLATRGLEGSLRLRPEDEDEDRFTLEFF